MGPDNLHFKKILGDTDAAGLEVIPENFLLYANGGEGDNKG